MKERLNKNTFISRAKEIHEDKYDYSKTIYVKAKEPVIIICRKHGEFKQRPQDHILKACGCPRCKGEKTTEVHSYNKEKFLELAKDKHGSKYNYSLVNYINYTTKVRIICPIHGEFEQVPRDHISGTGCPRCGREKANKAESYTTEQFIEKARKVHFNKYNYSKVEYSKSSEKVCIICPEHEEFWQTPANHLIGQGCPKCQLVGQTRLYNKLKESFPNIDIIFEADYKTIPWIENQRIDIYIPCLNLAIELMGPQHYKEIPFFVKNGSSLEVTQERDKRKRLKCKENNCVLIDVDYQYTNEDFKNLILEITKRLEELAKEDTDEAALEAGKILVEEILNNTVDNTNNLIQ